MTMLSGRKSKSIVGLDIEAGSIAATEVQANGDVQVTRTAVSPLEPGIFNEGEVTDAAALGEALAAMFSANKLGKSVRLGIANQRVAVRTLMLPPIDDPKELETAIRFQAQDHIPMPLEQAVLDYHVVGRRTMPDGEQRTAAVAVAARRDMIARCVEALKEAGLRPAGIDLSAFGMIRALAGPGWSPAGNGAGDEQPATLYCNLGDITNLAVAQGRTCLFTRVSTFGIEGIAQRLAERRRLSMDHARQWLSHVGLERPVEEIKGDAQTVAVARDALSEGAAKLTDEIRISLEFYGAQEAAVTVENLVVCGPGAAIPGLLDRLSVELGKPVGLGRPNALATQDPGTAARLTLSYGLALEE
jgi:type IV pilus assembly protein PilM